MAKVRIAMTPTSIGTATKFNPAGRGDEVIVCFEGGDCDSIPIRELDVLLPDGKWYGMSYAFRERQLIPDNYNREFRPPKDSGEQLRGWY